MNATKIEHKYVDIPLSITRYGHYLPKTICADWQKHCKYYVYYRHMWIESHPNNNEYVHYTPNAQKNNCQE